MPSFPRSACILSALLALALAPIVFPLPTARAAGEPDELLQAIIAHEKAVAAALASVNADYKATMEKTLQSAKESNNLDLLARAQQEIDGLAVKPPTLEGLGPKAEFVGLWNNLYFPTGGTQVFDLLPDGGWLNRERQRGGKWRYTDKEIIMDFDRNRDWHDHYDLPVKDGVLQGHNAENHYMQLTRQGAPISEAAKALCVGTWKFHNTRDDHRAEVVLDGDGNYNEKGKRIGSWQIGGNQLFIAYDGNDGHDIYDLPARDGVLQGRGPAGPGLSLTRADAK